MRPMCMRVSRSMQVTTACTLLAALAGCAGTGDGGGARESMGPSSRALCTQATGPNVHVLGAWATTVKQVREHRGGPGDISPAADPWAKLPADSKAAWCKIRTAAAFVVGAATDGGPFVRFMESATRLPGAYPKGPAIP